MLRAIQIMGWPLDAIVSVDIWFDDETPGELPPMVAFKEEWDAKCLAWFGLPVTHLCAKLTYKEVFYRHSPKNAATMKNGYYGFPMQHGNWCTALKTAPLNKRQCEGQKINIVQYIGIAADEPKRIERHMPKTDIILPLVQIGWDEGLCGLEATYMDMLSPTYNGSCRDGCWFCHNQGVGQLRNLRKNYPDLWAKLMKIDLDSPVTFHADGHTVHDFDARFQLEDEGWVTADEPWKWSYLKFPPAKQYTLF